MTVASPLLSVGWLRTLFALVTALVLLACGGGTAVGRASGWVAAAPAWQVAWAAVAAASPRAVSDQRRDDQWRDHQRRQPPVTDERGAAVGPGLGAGLGHLLGVWHQHTPPGTEGTEPPAVPPPGATTTTEP